MPSMPFAGAVEGLRDYLQRKFCGGPATAEVVASEGLAALPHKAANRNFRGSTFTFSLMRRGIKDVNFGRLE
jgi:hypothetical protein